LKASGIPFREQDLDDRAGNARDLHAFQKEMQARQADRIKAAGEKNRKEGAVFLEENKKKEG